MIKRFYFRCEKSKYSQNPVEKVDSDGDWVRYEDHAEEVRELERASEADDLAIYELEEEIAELKRQLLTYKEAKGEASLDEMVKLWPAGTL
jgi:hypothetical protein